MNRHPVGYRGSWFADLGDERLPCVHEYWTRNGRYNDPGCMPNVGKWPRFIRAIASGGRVLMTRSKISDAPNRKSGKSLARRKYLSVWEVGNVQADDESLRFDLIRQTETFE